MSKILGHFWHFVSYYTNRKQQKQNKNNKAMNNLNLNNAELTALSNEELNETEGGCFFYSFYKSYSYKSYCAPKTTYSGTCGTTSYAPAPTSCSTSSTYSTSGGTTVIGGLVANN